VQTFSVLIPVAAKQFFVCCSSSFGSNARRWSFEWLGTNNFKMPAPTFRFLRKKEDEYCGEPLCFRRENHTSSRLCCSFPTLLAACKTRVFDC